MSALTNAAETALLRLLFENVDWADIGDATGLQGSSGAGSFYIALFTADPGEAGSSTNECDYTSYDRVAVARGTAQWTVTGDEVVNDNTISFPQSTGGATDTATHWAICEDGTPGVDDLIIHGALDASLDISSGITPQIAAGALSVTAA